MSKKDTPLVGMESLLSRLGEIASISPSQVRQVLSAQIDALALISNDACLEAFAIIRDPGASKEERVNAMKMMSSLGFFTDSVSRQRVALQKEVAALPMGEKGRDRPLIAASGELSHEDFEKKYAPQLLPPTKTN